MTQSWIDIAGAVLVGAGAFVYLVGALGLARMPDFYTRIHAVSVADTLGAILIFAGLMIAGGLTLVTAKLAIILLLILLTTPFATHALSQTARHEGVEAAEGTGEIDGRPSSTS
jgi:multicomponent Na+:H+ antiporter subunit G